MYLTAEQQTVKRHSLGSEPQYGKQASRGKISSGKFTAGGHKGQVRQQVSSTSQTAPSSHTSPGQTRKRAKMRTQEKQPASIPSCRLCRDVALSGASDLQTYLEDQSIQQHLVPGRIFYHFAEPLFGFI